MSFQMHCPSSRNPIDIILVLPLNCGCIMVPQVLKTQMDLISSADAL